MRGRALIDPAVVGALEPFIVTSWHGHRQDRLPPQVAEVWQRKFSRGGQQSNVDLAFLNPKGQLVLDIDAMPGHSPEGVRENMLQAVASAGRLMPLPAGRHRVPSLPPALGGLRTITMLDEPVMLAYQAPVVEVRPVNWSALDWPTAPRQLPAEVLGQVLRTIYPAGMMDRTDPVSKEVYPITQLVGQLTLRPTGPREAVLSGAVRLHDAGPDGFFYQGQLDMLLAYDPGGQVKGCQGIFDGQYPRWDPSRRTWRSLHLVSILERD